MTDGFQVTDDNPMVGLEGRSNLLKRLAKVLDEQSTYFPSINDEPRRPGNLVGKLNYYTSRVPLLVFILFFTKKTTCWSQLNMNKLKQRRYVLKSSGKLL